MPSPTLAQPVKSGMIRLWTIEDGVHPARPPFFHALAVVGDPTYSFGERTKIEAPDPNEYESFVEIGNVKGGKERPTFPLNGRYPLALSTFLRLARKECRLDVFAFIGACKNPQDFTEGWEKILFFPDGAITTWSGENFAALASDDNEATNENVEMSSRDFYEYGQMKFSRLADSDTVRETTTIDVCDDKECGDCGRSSDGCQRVLATMSGTGATPGTLPSLLYSDDKGSTWSSQDISTLTSTETVADAHCIGANLVLISNASHSFHITNVDDLYDGTNTWVEIDSGFLIANGPNALWSPDVNHTWVVGDGGYVYFAINPMAGVSVQDAGVATSQNLQDVHAFDSENVLAVGNLNAVIYTLNGGDNWNSVTGPAPGIQLQACWMWSPDVWFVGDTVGGFFFTQNAGITWSNVNVTPFTATEIDDIIFVNEAEGYAAVRDGTNAARIWRTITGGYEWKLLPDDRGAQMPAASNLNDLAVCEVGSNVVFGAGLDDDGTTGIIVKAEA